MPEPLPIPLQPRLTGRTRVRITLLRRRLVLQVELQARYREPWSAREWAGDTYWRDATVTDLPDISRANV